MDERLAALTKEIQISQAALREKALDLRKSNPSLSSPVEKSPLSLSVCAVDGGVLSQRLHGHDIVITRSVGVNFVYSGSSLRSFSYCPSRSPGTSIDICGALDEHEANAYRSLLRLRSELSCAISAVGKFKPHLLLLDGSLRTVPSDRPPAESKIGKLYEEVIALYISLYSICENSSTQLCGVIKDSRSRRLAKDYGMDCSDTVLCSHMLKAGEHTDAFNYFDSLQKEAGDYWDKIKVLYLKPSENDLPLRIEFLGSLERAPLVASQILSLSSISENFAYPAILIEADMRAALQPSEMLAFESAFSAIKPLRRDSRPFR